MGIYDRDYVRAAPTPRGPFATGSPFDVRMWSANTWMIVLCVLVFVADGFTPPQIVPMGIMPWGVDVSNAVARPDLARNMNGLIAVPLFDGSSGQKVADEIYQSMNTLTAYLHFSTAKGFLGIEYWRFLGFQFLHFNPTHLIFNMVGLFFFGPMVERYLGSKRYLAYYLLCGIFGALMYLLLNLAGYIVATTFPGAPSVPGLLFNDTHTPLIGASAGVFGVLMAGAFIAPRAQVLLFFILPIQLRTLAYALVAIAFLSVLFGSRNAGGEAAHLGGALAGFYFIRRPHHLHGFFDVLGRVDPTSHHYRANPGKRSINRAEHTAAHRAASDAEIDRILKKVHDSGLQSLSEEERATLREASRE